MRGESEGSWTLAMVNEEIDKQTSGKGKEKGEREGINDRRRMSKT